MPYIAPIKDMLFDMQHLAQLDTLVQDIPVFSDATLDTARSILEEAARFHQEVTAPLKQIDKAVLAGRQLARRLLVSQQPIAQVHDDTYGDNFHRRKILTTRLRRTSVARIFSISFAASQHVHP